jgi:hypothetical protein
MTVPQFVPNETHKPARIDNPIEYRDNLIQYLVKYGHDEESLAVYSISDLSDMAYHPLSKSDDDNDDELDDYRLGAGHQLVMEKRERRCMKRAEADTYPEDYVRGYSLHNQLTDIF